MVTLEMDTSGSYVGEKQELHGQALDSEQH